MIESYVLVETDVGMADRVTREAMRFENVTSADALTGPCDVIMRVHGDDLESLYAAVDEIQGIDGVTRTTTCFVLAQGVSIPEAASVWGDDTAA